VSTKGVTGGHLLAIACIVVVLSVAAAVWVMGSPASQREMRLDERRQRDLQGIEVRIQAYWKAKKALPADLATLARQPGVSLQIQDPLTQVPYGYEISGANAYRLCAVFTTDTALASGRGNEGYTLERWPHGAGRMCFDRSTTDGKD